jgi:hypothetical protein
MTDLKKQAADLRFDILRNAIYHTSRSQFLDFLTRVINFFIILLGTAAAAQLGEATHRFDDRWLAGAAALVATIQLVGDFGVAGRTHSYLQRRCYELLAELEMLAPLEEANIATLRAKLTTLYGEEPPPMRALDAVAYNAACDSLGKEQDRVKIGALQSFFRHIYPFYGTEFISIHKSNAVVS